MSTGLRITQVVLLLIGVMTLYGCGSAALPRLLRPEPLGHRADAGGRTGQPAE